MGADDNGPEAILLGLLGDALALKAPDERTLILDRILAGEEPLTVEMCGGQVLVFLFGEQIAARSLTWFFGGPAEPER